MVTPPTPIVVEVPASSANLGPGFDALALALAMYLRTTVVRSTADSLEVRGEGAGQISLSAENRFLAGLERGLRELDGRRPPLRMAMDNDIPLARGLGSSAAAAVAGLLTAYELLGRRPDRQRIVELAAELDGHADNSAAATLGGFVIVGRGADGRQLASRFEPPAGLLAVLFVPQRALSTEQMRAALPAVVAHADAAHNVAASAMVVAALTSGRLELLGAMDGDRLHQPFRAEHFPELPGLVAAAQAAGARGAALSGAGSTVLALTDDAARAPDIAGAMLAESQRVGLAGTTRIVAPDRVGARMVGQ